MPQFELATFFFLYFFVNCWFFNFFFTSRFFHQILTNSKTTSCALNYFIKQSFKAINIMFFFTSFEQFQIAFILNFFQSVLITNETIFTFLFCAFLLLFIMFFKTVNLFIKNKESPTFFSNLKNNKRLSFFSIWEAWNVFFWTNYYFYTGWANHLFWTAFYHPWGPLAIHWFVLTSFHNFYCFLAYPFYSTISEWNSIIIWKWLPRSWTFLWVEDNSPTYIADIIKIRIVSASCWIALIVPFLISSFYLLNLEVNYFVYQKMLDVPFETHLPESELLNLLANFNSQIANGYEINVRYFNYKFYVVKFHYTNFYTICSADFFEKIMWDEFKTLSEYNSLLISETPHCKTNLYTFMCVTFFTTLGISLVLVYWYMDVWNKPVL